MNDAIPSVRAIVCTAHFVLNQNPKAVLKDEDGPAYMALVSDWCLDVFQARNGINPYWEPVFEPGPGSHEGTRHCP